MSEPPHLSALVSTTKFLPAVNLAYLRFETFGHRTRIEGHASAKLEGVTDTSDELKESGHYKRLSAWAAIGQDRSAVAEQLGWSWWYPLVFDAQPARQLSKIMIWTASPTVLAGTVEASGQITIPALAEWIGWIALALEIMAIGSVVLVLAGNAHVSKAFTLIDSEAKQWRIFLRDRTPAAKTLQVP